jgi:hypothetical protein
VSELADEIARRHKEIKQEYDHWLATEPPRRGPEWLEPDASVGPDEVSRPRMEERMAAGYGYAESQGSNELDNRGRLFSWDGPETVVPPD